MASSNKKNSKLKNTTQGVATHWRQFGSSIIYHTQIDQLIRFSQFKRHL